MARWRDDIADRLSPDHGSGWALLAEEDRLDRVALWRLGSLGFATIGALALAVVAAQSASGVKREHQAALDLVRQAQQLERAAQAGQTETARLSSAVDTLNVDRDRLFTRLSTLEQGLDSVTGSISRLKTAAAAPSLPPVLARTDPPAPAPVAAVTPPQTSTPVGQPDTAIALPVMPMASPEAKANVEKPLAKADSERRPVKPKPNPGADPAITAAMLAPPDPAAAALKAAEPPAQAHAGASPEPAPETTAAVSVQRTEFGVDLGGAPNVAGLRALWRRLAKAHGELLSPLRPVIAIKEHPGSTGLQLRLVAGPMADAADAARLCAALAADKDGGCETAVFDGQRLAITAAEPKPPRAAKPTHAARRHVPATKPDDPPPPPPRASLGPLIGTN